MTRICLPNGNLSQESVTLRAKREFSLSNSSNKWQLLRAIAELQPT